MKSRFTKAEAFELSDSLRELAATLKTEQDIRNDPTIKFCLDLSDELLRYAGLSSDDGIIAVQTDVLVWRP